MSQQNLDIVTAGIRAACARPKPDWATIGELFSPDHVLVPLGQGVVSREERGAAGFRSWLQDTDAYLAPEHDLEGAVDVGPDKVLGVTTTRFTGSSSGVASEQRSWLVATVQGGKIVRTEIYSEAEQALLALTSASA